MSLACTSRFMLGGMEWSGADEGFEFRGNHSQPRVAIVVFAFNRPRLLWRLLPALRGNPEVPKLPTIIRIDGPEQGRIGKPCMRRQELPVATAKTSW